jgi:hypothetical protein
MQGEGEKIAQDKAQQALLAVPQEEQSKASRDKGLGVEGGLGIFRVTEGLPQLHGLAS